MKREQWGFKDGTVAKKWHEVFATQVAYYGFTREQAREVIEINPYFKKHDKDLEIVFKYMPNIFRPTPRDFDVVSYYKQRKGL